MAEMPIWIAVKHVTLGSIVNFTYLLYQISKKLRPENLRM